MSKKPELQDVIARFRELNEGFPVERFKADYVIAWMLANFPPEAPQPVHKSAVATLESKGYTYHGGQLWKPPIGKAPAYITDDFTIPEPATLTNINQLCPLDNGLSQTDFATGWNECRRVAMAKNAVPPLVKGISAQCQGWNACRADMLNGNCPVIRDGSQRREAEHVASVLEIIGSFEACDIDGDTVDLRFELDGVDTGSDASITEYASRGAAIILKLLNQDEIGSWNSHSKTPTDKPKSELLQRAEKLAEEAGALARRVQGEDLRAKVRAEHAEWAAATFGNTGPVGPLKHLSKEALEAAEAPNDLHEWADMQFLFWDAQRKAGVTDEQITEAMVEKLEINKCRAWPEPKDGEPRFHIKGQ